MKDKDIKHTRVIRSFFECVDETPVVHKVRGGSLTLPNKALDPRSIMDRINRGLSTEQEMYRGLPNDDNNPDFDNFNEEMLDLATAKERLADMSKTAMEDYAKQQRELANKASGDTDVNINKDSQPTDENLS